MPPFTLRGALALLLGSVSGAASAQLPQARLWALYPCGGQRGTTIRVTCEGADLEEPRALLSTGPTALKAALVKEPPQPGKAPGAAQFDVTLPAEAIPGLYELRVVGRYGISNPRVFAVSAAPVRVEQEPNDDVPQAQLLGLDQYLCGTIAAPTDVDFFRLTGSPGQTVTLICEAELLDSRLSPELTVYSTAGSRLSSGQSWLGRNVRTAVKLPADGTCWVRLCQTAYRSGDRQHFYRLLATAQPWVTTALPTDEAENQVRHFGFNLPGRQVVRSGVLWHSALRPIDSSPRQLWATQPPALLGFTAEWQAAAPGDNAWPRLRSALAERPWPEADALLAWPVAVSGLLDDPRHGRRLRFAARKGQTLVAEVFAQRLGSPLDLHLEFRKGDGTLLGEFDDPAEPLAPRRFHARTDDPKAVLAIPDDGEFQLVVGCRDRTLRPDPRHYFVLELRPARPDFRLVVMEDPMQSPSSLQLARGSHRPVEVLVQRVEGFSGPITLSAKSLPAGVTALPQVLPAQANSTQFILSIAENAAEFAGQLQLVGTADLGGEKRERTAAAATQVWPMPGDPAIPAAARFTSACYANVREAPPVTLHRDLEEVVTVPGGVVPVPLRLQRRAPEAGGALSVIPLVLPPGAVFQNKQPAVAVPPGQSTAIVELAIPPGTSPGEYTLVLAVAGPVPFAKAAGAAKTPVTVQEACAPIRVLVLAPPPESTLVPLPTQKK